MIKADYEKMIEQLGKEAKHCDNPKTWLQLKNAQRYLEEIINENLTNINEHPWWIPVTEKLPKNEEEVEITYTCKHWKTGEPLYFTCRAFYTDGTMNTEDSNYTWDETDNCEYNENLDAYIIPEGWWEFVTFSEAFSRVDQPVVAWMPLPEPYKAGD